MSEESDGMEDTVGSITLTSDLALVQEFLRQPGVRYVCSPERGPSPSLLPEDLAHKRLAVAVDVKGQIQAAAWLEKPGELQGSAVGVLALSPSLARFPRTAAMLSLLANETEAHSIRQFTTCVTREVTNPVAEFRDAGLRVVSKFNIGGTMELVLERATEQETTGAR